MGCTMLSEQLQGPVQSQTSAGTSHFASCNTTSCVVRMFALCHCHSCNVLVPKYAGGGHRDSSTSTFTVLHTEKVRWAWKGKPKQLYRRMYHWLWRLLSVLFFNLFSFWIYLLYASCSTVWHSSVLACSLHYLRNHIYLLFVIYRPGCIKIFLGHT